MANVTCGRALRVYVVESLMSRNDLNQKELANAIGVHPSTINKYLRRKSHASDIIAKKMATVLGCDVEDIMEDREAHAKATELEKEVNIVDAVEETVDPVQKEKPVIQEAPRQLSGTFMDNYYELGHSLTKVVGYMDILKLDLDTLYETADRCNLTEDKLLRFKGRHFDDLVDILEKMGLYQRKENR